MSESMVRKKQPTGTANGSQPVLRCSFCYRDEHQVKKLIAGPTVFICDECIDFCNSIIVDDARFAGTAEIRDQNRANVLAAAFPGVRSFGGCPARC
jgi:hypothetical protein